MNLKNMLVARAYAIALSFLLVGAVMLTVAPGARADWHGSWASEPPLGEAKTQAVVVADPEGVVYIVGGVINAAAYYAVPTVESYDPSDGSSQSLAEMPIGVRGAAGAMGLDGRIYVFSGANTSVVNDTQIFDPATDTWTIGAEIPIGVWEAKAATTSDGRIWVVGGEEGEAYDILSIVQVYDPTTDSWSTAASLPSERIAGALVTDGEHLYYLGGDDVSYSVTATVYMYTVADDTWESLSSMPGARAAHAAVMGYDGQIYLMGGSDSSGNTYGSVQPETYVYHPDDDTWSTSAPDLNFARKYLGATLVPDGRILAMGGNTATEVLDMVESLATWAFDYVATVSPSSVPAGGSVMVTLDASFIGSEEEAYELWWYLQSADGTVYGSYHYEYVWDMDAISFEVSVPELAVPGDYYVVIDEWWVFGDVTTVVVDTFNLSFEVLAPEPIEDMISALELQIADLQAQINETSAALEAQIADLQTQIEDLSDAMDAADTELLAQIADLEALVVSLQSALSTLEASVSDDYADLMDELGAVIEANADLLDEIFALQDEITALQEEITSLENSLGETNTDVGDVQTSVDDKMSATLGYAIIGLLVVVILLLIAMMMSGRKSVPPPPSA